VAKWYCLENAKKRLGKIGVMFVDGCIFLGSGFDCGVVKCTKLLCILSYAQLAVAHC
jgi:hypothetical protein